MKTKQDCLTFCMDLSGRKLVKSFKLKITSNWQSSKYYSSKNSHFYSNRTLPAFKMLHCRQKYPPILMARGDERAKIECKIAWFPQILIVKRAGNINGWRKRLIGCTKLRGTRWVKYWQGFPLDV